MQTDPGRFVPTPVELAFLEGLRNAGLPFMVLDIWCPRDEPDDLHCELLFDRRDLKKVAALARSLGAQPALRKFGLVFRGPLSRLGQVFEEDFGVLPLKIELFGAEAMTLAKDVVVLALPERRYETLHLPRTQQHLPPLPSAPSRTASPGRAYVFARFACSDAGTAVIVVDREGELLLEGHRPGGATPRFGDRVRLAEDGTLHVLRRARKTPRILARNTAPDCFRLPLSPFDDVLERAHAILRASNSSNELPHVQLAGP